MRRRHEYDVHHLFPSSLFPRFRRASWNLRPVRKDMHVAWHCLAGNKSPLSALLELFYAFTPYERERLLSDPAFPAFVKLLRELETVEILANRERRR